MIFNKNQIWKYGTLSVSPFDWLEAGYFYYRPSDLLWGSASKKGQYLDKGFNVKLIYRSKNYYIPNIAVGLDDFAGTGYFGREYIVSTKDFKNTKISLGMGWGKFTGEGAFKNPLSRVSNRFTFRPDPAENAGFAGKPSYKEWFRGDAAFFGGIEYTIPNAKGIKLKLEYDPFDYFDFSANYREDALEHIRNKDSKINIGFSFPVNKFLTIDSSYIKGNAFNLSFSFGLNFNEEHSLKKKFNPEVKKNSDEVKSKKVFYKELLSNLNKNQLFLQTANLNEDGRLDISVSTSNYRNAIRSSARASQISKMVGDLNEIDLSTINVSHINAGIELNNITYIASYFENNSTVPVEVEIRNTRIDSGNPNDIKGHEFKPRVPFPLYFGTFNPAVVSHVGYPSKFYFGGLNLEYLGELQFNRNLIYSFLLSQRIYGNLDETISRPDSQLENVRTGVVNYIQEDDLKITRMQMDYIFSPYKDIYTRFTGGIFETMFAGLGMELLYKPFNKKYSLGLEIFDVKQRSYKQRFDFLDYRTTTGHLSLDYQLPMGIIANLSFGRYLAKDDGYTLDLSRRTRSGFLTGFYFTRTDVPAELFGEGSFDKGFYFQFPLDIFSKEYRGDYSTFKFAPLTRDGGAKLIYDKSLRGLIYNSTYSELNNQWHGLYWIIFNKKSGIARFFLLWLF